MPTLIPDLTEEQTFQFVPLLAHKLCSSGRDLPAGIFHESHFRPLLYKLTLFYTGALVFHILNIAIWNVKWLSSFGVIVRHHLMYYSLIFCSLEACIIRRVLG